VTDSLERIEKAFDDFSPNLTIGQADWRRIEKEYGEVL
jgi:hypothetical protein